MKLKSGTRKGFLKITFLVLLPWLGSTQTKTRQSWKNRFYIRAWKSITRPSNGKVLWVYSSTIWRLHIIVPIIVKKSIGFITREQDITTGTAMQGVVRCCMMEMGLIRIREKERKQWWRVWRTKVQKQKPIKLLFQNKTDKYQFSITI